MVHLWCRSMHHNTKKNHMKGEPLYDNSPAWGKNHIEAPIWLLSPYRRITILGNIKPHAIVSPSNGSLPLSFPKFNENQYLRQKADDHLAVLEHKHQP